MHLRVWWEEVTEQNLFSKNKTEEMTGVVIGPVQIGCVSLLTVRTDDGEFFNVATEDIKNSEWVNHPTNAD